MIVIHNTDQLKDSIAYEYYRNAIKEKLKYFVSINNGFQGHALLSSLDENDSGVIWAEDEGKIVACASFHLMKKSKKIFVINFFHADTDSIYKQVNEYIEDFARKLDCFFIEEMVTANDSQRIDYLENLGYLKEFSLLFKKV